MTRVRYIQPRRAQEPEKTKCPLFTGWTEISLDLPGVYYLSRRNPANKTMAGGRDAFFFGTKRLKKQKTPLERQDFVIPPTLGGAQ